MKLMPVRTTLICVLLAACADTTKLRTPEIKDRLVEVDDLLALAKCELDIASQREGQKFGLGEATIDFALKVIETRSQVGTGTIVVPVQQLALSLNGNFGPSNTTTRTINFKINYSPSVRGGCNDRAIEGGLGIPEWLSSMDRIAEKGGLSAGFSQSVKFEISMTRDLTPKISRTDSSDDSRSLSLKGAANPKFSHEITVTIAPKFPGRRTPTRAQRETIQEDFLRRLPDL